jgi:competence protein CoiA
MRLSNLKPEIQADMQYFAINLNDQKIQAHMAQKGENYICPDCKAPVRKRVSRGGKAHFFHLANRKTCAHAKKSEAHLSIQENILNIFGAEKAILEHRFEKIQRIADVAVLSEGLIFEIQCSKISIQEIESRERDYTSLGLQVVWVLHDKVFNKKMISPAEKRLRDGICYYSNEKMIYDQLEILKRRKRIYRSIPHPIDIKTPLINDQSGKRSPIHFKGDLLDKFSSYPSYKEWAIELISRYTKKGTSLERLKKYATHLESKYRKMLNWLYLQTHHISMTFPDGPTSHKDNFLTNKNKKR